MSALRLVAALALHGCGGQVITVLVEPADAAVHDAPTPALSARYAWTSPRAACHRALGRVSRADGQRCGAVMLSPTIALTTAGCVLERAGGAYLPARALTFTLHGAASPVAVSRVVHGRDADDPRAGGDWAALMLDAPVEGVAAFPSVGLASDRLRGVEVVGYTRAAGDELGVSTPADLRRYDEDSLSHSAAFDPALSGGAVLQCERGVATLYALTTTRGDARERARYNAVPLDYARDAPLAPTRITAGPATVYGPVVYAFDALTRRVHIRTRDGARWSPWKALPVELPAGSVIAAAGLRLLDMPYLVVLGADRTLRHLWSDWRDGTALSNLGDTMAPVPGSAPLRDVAITGSAVDRIEVYVVDATGMVFVANKVDDSVTAAWSDWYELGRVPGAARIAAGTARGVDGGPVRTLVVSTPEGVHIDWSGTGYGLSAWEPRSEGFPRFITAAQTRPALVALSSTLRGQPVVLRITDEGRILRRERLADGTAWTDEEPFARQLDGGLSALANGTLRDGRALLVAVTRDVDADAPTGEVFSLTEDDTPGGGFARARWGRFYR